MFDLLPKLQFDMYYIVLVRPTLSRHSIEDPITLIDITFSYMKRGNKFNFNLYVYVLVFNHCSIRNLGFLG